MIVVLLLCFLSDVKAYTRNQHTEDQPEWPPESDVFLDQMAKDMFGYNVEDLLEFKPNVFAQENKERRDLWGRLAATIVDNELNRASNGVIESFLLLEARGISEKSKTKTALADIWERLTPQKQNQWKEMFPYAVYTEKLANIRKGIIEIPEAL